MHIFRKWIKRVEQNQSDKMTEQAAGDAAADR